MALVGLLLTVAIMSVVLSHSIQAGEQPSPSPELPIFAPASDHPWNQLQRVLFLRTGPDGATYGMDETDPLLFQDSTHLLVGVEHETALRVLDHFIASHDEGRITDPLKRVLMQHDLWALFDWLAKRDGDRALSAPARDLRTRLAAIMRRLAMSSEVLRTLPDNYAALSLHDHGSDGLPDDLFQVDSPYVCIGVDGGGAAAPVHQRAFGGRSAFLVFLRLPDGRQATVEYLKRLNAFALPWVPNPKPDNWGPLIIHNPETPQFPDGTRLALVRRLIAIDDKGNLVVTPITESIQVRVHRHVTPVSAKEMATQRAESEEIDQEVHDVEVRRRGLFAGRGGLEEIGRDGVGFLHINPLREDPFDATAPEVLKGAAGPVPTLRTCGGCHRLPGVFSFNTYMQFFREETVRPPSLHVTDFNSAQEAARIGKLSEFSWGLLRATWDGH